MSYSKSYVSEVWISVFPDLNIKQWKMFSQFHCFQRENEWWELSQAMTEHNGNFIFCPCWVNGLEFYNITKILAYKRIKSLWMYVYDFLQKVNSLSSYLSFPLIMHLIPHLHFYQYHFLLFTDVAVKKVELNLIPKRFYLFKPHFLHQNKCNKYLISTS